MIVTWKLHRKTMKNMQTISMQMIRWINVCTKQTHKLGWFHPQLSTFITSATEGFSNGKMRTIWCTFWTQVHGSMCVFYCACVCYDRAHVTHRLVYLWFWSEVCCQLRIKVSTFGINIDIWRCDSLWFYIFCVKTIKVLLFLFEIYEDKTHF